MSKSPIKHIKSPILWISFTFLILSTITLIIRNTVDDESRHLSVGLIDIKSALIKVQKMTFLVNLQSKKNAKENLQKLESINEEYSKLLNKLKENKSSHIIIANSFKKIYFDEDFRIDEQFSHIEKLINLYLKSVKSFREQELKKLLLDIRIATDRVSLFEPLIADRVQSEINKINNFDSIVTYTLFFLIILLILFTYIYTYIPWQKQVEMLKHEKETLDEVLQDSEKRAQVYPWELDANDMSIVRSHKLSVLLNGEMITRKILLSEELKLFSKKSRNDFIEALDIVLEEGRALDIEVHVTGAGRYEYWLHYHGVYNKEKNKIVGTVKDNSAIRKSENRFFKLFDCVPHPMVMILEDSVYRMNDFAYKYFEISDKEKYQDINYSLLFPMYQHDKTPSLDKVNDLKDQIDISGRATSDYMTFRSANGEDVTTKTELFNVSYNESKALVLALSNDSMRHQFERRLIEANKKALHERRKKAEYVAHYNTMIIHLTEVLKTSFSGTGKKKEEFELKINSLFSKIDRIWQENLAYVVDGRNNILLTNTKELFKELSQRWHSAALRHNVQVELELVENANFYWIDIEKMKAAMNALVHEAIRKNIGGNIEISVYIDDIGSRFGRFHFSLIDGSGDFDFSTLKDYDQTKKNSLHFISEIIEFLQGRLIADDSNENKISFSVDIERSNRETESKNEVLHVGEYDDRTHDIVDINSKFTFEDIIAHFGGDETVIQSLLKDFIDYYPVIVADMLMAIRDKDGNELESCASDLYGVISYFPYFKSIERVILLKKYGQFNKFDRAEEELYSLIAELKKFESLVENVLLNIKAA